MTDWQVKDDNFPNFPNFDKGLFVPKGCCTYNRTNPTEAMGDADQLVNFFQIIRKVTQIYNRNANKQQSQIQQIKHTTLKDVTPTTMTMLRNSRALLQL